MSKAALTLDRAWGSKGVVSGNALCENAGGNPTCSGFWAQV